VKVRRKRSRYAPGSDEVSSARLKLDHRERDRRSSRDSLGMSLM
jgi:hypothetical protein